MTEPKYQIGDHIGDTNIYVRGVATSSKGEHFYLWQIADNCMVVSEDEIETMMLILNRCSLSPELN